jgi:hypothetical protein
VLGVGTRAFVGCERGPSVLVGQDPHPVAGPIPSQIPQSLDPGAAQPAATEAVYVGD